MYGQFAPSFVQMFA